MVHPAALFLIGSPSSWRQVSTQLSSLTASFSSAILVMAGLEVRRFLDVCSGPMASGISSVPAIFLYSGLIQAASTISFFGVPVITASDVIYVPSIFLQIPILAANPSACL